jgi:hypothetical protein
MQANNTYHAMSMIKIIEMQKEVKALKSDKARLIEMLEAKEFEYEKLRENETNPYLERIYLGMRDGVHLSLALLKEEMKAT